MAPARIRERARFPADRREELNLGSRAVHPGPLTVGAQRCSHRKTAPGATSDEHSLPDQAPGATELVPPGPENPFRANFRIDYDHQQVTCPQGQVSAGWHGPYPTSSPTAAPLIVARFTKSQCRPCPARTQCTTTADSARTVGFPPRELRDLQLRVRAEQQTPEWKTRYAVRSGVEGTVTEFAHGHGMRRCRYRGQGKAHIQHVLTAIAVNIERLSGLPPTEEAPIPRRPTAFQSYLDQRELPRLKSWRTLGS
ncbi:transposase [Streptomyces griseorubiginosus]|uniref:transposase n=1 Tax=Streptomyces griseorubiginosus TaxID=67304 RepID=UPI0036E15B2A